MKKGETIQRIARLYQVEVDPLLEINRLKKGSPLSSGTNLLIPIPKSQPVTKPIRRSERRRPEVENRRTKPQETIYTIKKGDTLWSISSELGINIGALSRWNNLHPEKKLMPGDKLKIRLDGSTDTRDESPGGKREKEIIYVVKQGDSLWSIAKKYHLTVSDIRSWNHLNGKDQIRPADRLKLRVAGIKS